MTTAPPVAPADRGSLRIADRVLAKIATRAAREALSEAAGAEHVPAGTYPHALVSVHRRRAHIRLGVELGYPGDIAAVCRAVRAHVAGRVAELTGHQVAEVAVEVERLHSALSRAPAEGRVR